MAYYDATYLLVIIGVIISMIASAGVNSSMKKYAKVRNAGNITGADAARKILYYEGITDVQVERLSASSGDHYDPSSKTVRLSAANYDYPSVTAVAVASHECGHAIQHAHGYAPMSMRSALVPAVNIANKLSIPIIIIGMVLSWNQTLIQIGIWAFALTVLFQIVTLPVEFNASHRALVKMEQYGLATSDEKTGCRKVLTAAAFTYVAAATAAALQLLRLVLLSGGSRRRD
jgi:Zn-dependent membrane protease YugP